MKRERIVTKSRLVRKVMLAMAVFITLLSLGWWGIRSIAGARLDNGVQAPLRSALKANEELFSAAMSPVRLAKTYPVEKAVKNVRVNGNLGMGSDFDPAAWNLKVARGVGDTLFLSMAEIKRLPKTEIVFDFKCIEGWNQITHWGGVKMEDFIKAYHLDSLKHKRYIGLRTPDGGYYVGIDMASALHPQTILAYEMNDAPLPLNQGAPLRLIIPLKYGIKHLKRIGTIFFSDTPPRDYWAEQGYDYYAGH